MPDQSFNRTPLYPLEKPIVDDINQQASQADRSLRDVMYRLLNGQSGFLSNSLLVAPSSPAALSVVIKAGIGFQVGATDVPTNIGGVVGLNDLSPYKPIVLANDYSVAVPTPPGSNSRIDLIEVAYSRILDNNQSREFLDPTDGSFSPSLVAKTLDFNVDGTLAYYSATAVPTTALAYKSGVAGASPSPPAVDTGYIALAYITVASGASTITSGDIEDERPTATTQLVTKSIPASAANASSSATTFGGTDWTFAATTPQEIWYPIDVPVGATVIGYTAFLSKGSSGSTTISFQLDQTDMTTGASTFSPGVNDTDNAPGWSSKSESGLAFVQGLTNEMNIIVNAGAGSPSADRIYGILVTYTYDPVLDQ